MATLTITANAKTANGRTEFTSRMANVSNELATLITTDVVADMLKPYGGREKFGVEWEHSSPNTKVACFVKKGVEVVITATLF
jgi:hypothetical protein